MDSKDATIKSVSRSDIVGRIAEKAKNITPDQVDVAVRVIIEHMIDTIGHGRRIELRGFGVFNLANRVAGSARNPKTGQKVEVGERFVPRFKLSSLVYKALNPK